MQEDADTGQTLIGGMGELHLEVVFTKMRRQHKVSQRFFDHGWLSVNYFWCLVNSCVDYL
jgi:translation elongation factor EF-G